MARYFIDISFDGTNYHGWQIQPGAITVQEKLQEAISVLLRYEVEITGAGRTDAGVHAKKMIAHFDYSEELDCQQLTYKLNRFLPHDIVINNVYPVADDMHARFSALTRTYYYHIMLRKDPFMVNYSYRLPFNVDFELMNAAASYLLQVDDFASFCKVHTDVKTTLCNVMKAEWIDDGDGHWHFEITANRFLRNMVRAVVGTLLDVGRGKITVDEFKAIVASRKRTSAGESVPAKALFLQDITY